MTTSLPRRLLAGSVGTALLVTVVVGSGIAASAFSPGDIGLELILVVALYPDAARSADEVVVPHDDTESLVEPIKFVISGAPVSATTTST